ncbi:MAG: hypothetical protein AB8E15_06270 [Bdellovibrionales bacterium]
MKRRNIKIVSLLMFSGAMMLGFGHACSQYHADGSGNLDVFAAEDIIFYGEKTVSVVSARQVLDNYTECLQIRDDELSNDVVSTFNNTKASLAIKGEAGEVNGPMMMALTSLSGALCDNVIRTEEILDSSNRGFFKEIDFDRDQWQEEAMVNSMRRLSRSCWRRNEDPEERDRILNEIVNTYGNSPDPRTASLFMCTAILASADAFVN